MVLDSSWADEIRSRPAAKPQAGISSNIEIGSNGYDQRATAPTDNCVVAQIERDVACAARSARAHAGAAEALALSDPFCRPICISRCMPPTATTRAAITSSCCQGRRRSNLHRVWDEDVVEALGPDPMAIAADIEAELSPARTRRASCRARRPTGPMKLSLGSRARNLCAVCRGADRCGCRAIMPSGNAPWCASNWPRRLRLAALLNAIYR